MDPFLKWAGGKRRILPELIKRLPEDYRKRDYYEPFLGGGALFWELASQDEPDRPRTFNLGDTNWALIETYLAVRDDVAKVAQWANEWMQVPYYTLRDKFNTAVEAGGSAPRLAGMMIALNRRCFNGLWRVNKKGEFNVPEGKMKNPQVPDLMPHWRVLNQPRVHIGCNTYGHTTLSAGYQAFVYLDPPYLDTFGGYTAGGFDLGAHEQLAAYCRRLAGQGTCWMLSNSDTPTVRDLYADFHIEEVQAPMSVSRGERGMRGELIIRNY